MLDDKKIEVLTERVVNRLTKANTKLLTEIGKKINLIGSINPSDLDKIVNMLKYGGDYETIIAELMKATGLNSKDLLAIFDRVAEHNLNAVKDLYKYRNKEFIPYKENQALQSIVKQVSEDAIKDYLNLSNTLGFRTIVNGRVKYQTLRETYINAIDSGVLAVRTGTTDYTSAMKSVVKELGESGVRTVDYASGYSRRLDTAVRMNIQDSIMRLHNETQKHLGEELGCNGIEVSHHKNSAPDHISTVDGKQFTTAEFNAVNNSLERQVSTMNCRHITYSIILGISKPRWSEEELQKDKEENEKGFTYKGKHYTNYEGTQLLRKIETSVREQQDIKAMGNAEATTEANTKIRMLMEEYNEIAKVSGLSTRKERLRSGLERVKTIDISTPPKETKVVKSGFNDVNEVYKSVNLKGIEKPFADKIEKELLDLQNDYPIFKGKIEITARDKQQHLGYFRTGIHGGRSDGKQTAQAIYNLNINGGLHKTENFVKRVQEINFKSRGSKLIESKTGLTTIGHEYGHAIDFAYGFEKNKEVKNFFGKYINKKIITSSKEVVEINYYNNLIHNSDNLLSNVVWEKMENIYKSKGNAGFKELVKKELGSYALVDKKEFLAEGFANMRYLKNKDKTQFIQDFENIFNDEFRKVFKNASNK